jgi:hypothetical protein
MKVDWSEVPDWATHALTTGPEWSGSSDMVGEIEFVICRDGHYYAYPLCFVLYEISNKGWIVLEERPKHDQPEQEQSYSDHYDKYLYKVKVNQDDADKGFVTVKLDPYRVAKVCNIGGGALEQTLKKSMRGTDKGHSERVVLEEIICAAKRGIDMLDEDGINE